MYLKEKLTSNAGNLKVSEKAKLLICNSIYNHTLQLYMKV